MTLKIAQFLNLALVVLLAGAMWGTWLGLGRSMDSFSANTYLDIGHAMIGNLAPVMPVLMLSAIVSAVPVAVLLYRQRSSRFLFVVAGLTLLLITILITVLVEVPINDQMRAWTPTSLPADWKEIRHRWALFHLIRTFSSLGAVGLFLAAAVFGTPPSEPARPH